MAPKRAVSAYFLFCNEHREATKAEYLAKAEIDKVSVAVIAKLLGEKWRGLSDDDRKSYQAKAAEQAANIALPANQDDHPMEGTGQDDRQVQQEEGTDIRAAEFAQPYGFPLSSVRRIVNMDEDVKSISSDALKATAKAAELIVQQLAAKALKVALSNKRKTIKFSDIQNAIARDRRWDMAGLKDLLQQDEMFEEARTGHANTAAGKPKKFDEDPKAQQITAFFKT